MLDPPFAGEPALVEPALGLALPPVAAVPPVDGPAFPALPVTLLPAVAIEPPCEGSSGASSTVHAAKKRSDVEYMGPGGNGFARYRLKLG